MRYREIDVFKGILVLQMILAHCFHFFVSLYPGTWENAVSDYINLTTFSGFIFAYGFAAWFAYVQKDYKVILPRLISSILKMLAAYYISAFAFRIFIDGIFINWNNILDILLLRSLAGWSEFLLSFAAVMVLILCFQPLMKKAGKYLPLIVAVVAVIAVLIPLRTSNTIVATFIGQAPFAVFAVIPYCIYLALGIYIAQSEGKLKPWMVIATCVGTAGFVAVYLIFGMPSRFPLSLPWLLGASAFITLYYFVSKLIAGRKFSKWIEDIGKNSLFYLLMSNIFIFALRSSNFSRLNTTFALIVFVVFVLMIMYLEKIIVKSKLAKLSEKYSQ